MGDLEAANVGTDDENLVFPGERLYAMERAATLGLSGRIDHFKLLVPNSSHSGDAGHRDKAL